MVSELHPRPEWVWPHASATLISAHPSHVAPNCVPPKAPGGGATFVRPTHFGTALTRFVAPWGAPPKSALTTALFKHTCGWVPRHDDLLVGLVVLHATGNMPAPARKPQCKVIAGCRRTVQVLSLIHI
eukprot:2781877-Pyramimonas_sp.AAC.2